MKDLVHAGLKIMGHERYKIIGLAIGAALLMFVCGCEQGLRWEPTENIKGSAELTNDLALKVNNEGTEPKSPATQKLVQGTQVSLSYIGRPKVPADPEQFDTIIQQAQPEAEQRPDAWKVTDAILELCIGIGGLGTGAGALRFVKFLMDARARTTALQEVVKGSELFKKKIKESGTLDAIVAFKAAQNEAQSDSTKLIVAGTKLI